ncbi:MAG: CheY-like chemotaxis protein [Cellvibrionaceae bacterium]|jgi:CheY-like chemotaxis protein
MHMIDQSTNKPNTNSQRQSRYISIVNLVIVTRSQRVASQIERMLSDARARAYAIRWAFDPLSLQKLMGMGRTDILLLDATSSEVNEFVNLLSNMPGLHVPIIALIQNAQAEMTLDKQISERIEARIDATRLSRSLLSRTIRQVVAATYANSNVTQSTEMEVQGIRVTTSPRTMLDLSKVTINELCDDCLNDIRPMAESKEIEVYEAIEEELFRIMCDGKHVRKMLTILLGNALRHTPSKGAIGLELTGDREYETLHITVWDSGVGIEQDQLVNLYKADWLSDEVDDENSLRYVQKYAQLHEGLLSIDSEPGRGTRITMSVPWETAVNLSNGRLWQNSFRRLIRILLVEDDEIYLDTTAQFLEANNYEVVRATNGEEALKKVKETRPDMVLMDLEMPIMGGVDAIRHIRAMDDPELSKVPIIAFTALALTRDRQASMIAGANDYISKPVSLRWLAQSITRQLEKKHLLETLH